MTSSPTSPTCACVLCGCRVEAASEVRLVTAKDDLDALAFLGGDSSHQSCPPPRVCARCFDKVRLVSTIRRDAAKGDKAGEQEEEEDCDYEELNQLSSFYAENDEEEEEKATEHEEDDDTDYEQLFGDSTSRRRARTSSPSRQSEQHRPRPVPYLNCHLCPASLRRVTALRKHYISMHGYEPAVAIMQEEKSNLNSKEGEEEEEEKKECPPAESTARCVECDRSFLGRQLLIKHVLDAHVPDSALPSFRCNRCEKVYRHARDLRTHQERLCPAVIGLVASCPHCSKSYAATHLKNHISHAHYCRFCEKPVAATRKEKVAHLRERHLADMTDACGQCGERFETSKCLQRHQRCAHAMKFVSCPRRGCSRLFAPSNGAALRSHLRRFHDPEKEKERAGYKFECPECHRRVKTADQLRAHRRTAHSDPGGPRAKCPYCELTVSAKRRSQLDRHVRRVHPEAKEDIARLEEKSAKRLADLTKRARVQCLLCSYAATRAGNMARHYVEVHGYDKEVADRSEPDPEYPDGALCPVCGEHFVNRHQQMKHLLQTHTKTTGEQCLYCQHRYLCLEEHIDERHQAEKMAPEQFCKKCLPEQKFSSFGDLLRHTRTYHRKQPAKESKKKKTGKLCENCGKTVSARFMSRHHRVECPKARAKTRKEDVDDFGQELSEEDGNDDGEEGGGRKKYVPVKLEGICPFCEFKFADLLGHIRLVHKDKKKKSASTAFDGSTVDSEDTRVGVESVSCQLCSKAFNSVRELVTHRQLHPQFKSHPCRKCSAEFEHFVDLRNHRLNECPKRKKKRKAFQQASRFKSDVSTAASSQTGGGTLHLTSWDRQAAAGGATASDWTFPDGGPPALPAQQQQQHQQQQQQQHEVFEGRGTVGCMLCTRTFTLKVLLRRHYVGQHGYKPDQVGKAPSDSRAVGSGSSSSSNSCRFCQSRFASVHDLIRHHLDCHCVISGLACPYCDGCKKFDDVDAHVRRHHPWDMQSPIQDCKVCKTRFSTYEELRVHRQIHDKKTVEVVVGNSTSSGADVMAVHSRVGAMADISNRGGVKCLLCNTFKLRKDHLKNHYVRHHGYDPKQTVEKERPKEDGETQATSSMAQDDLMDDSMACPSCQAPFDNRHLLIRHALRTHTAYNGLICPYCWGRHPERFLDLKAHVTQKHMDELMGYNVCNSCRVCKEKFGGYAELKDHVQAHGEAYRAPYGNKTEPSQGRKRRSRKTKEEQDGSGGGQLADHPLPPPTWPPESGQQMQRLLDETFRGDGKGNPGHGDEELHDVNPDSDLHSVSISSTLFNQIFHGEGDAREESGGASEKKNEDEIDPKLPEVSLGDPVGGASTTSTAPAGGVHQIAHRQGGKADRVFFKDF